MKVNGGVAEMAVFRIEKNSDYTVMSNHHLRNNALSLRAKGLLSQMLSLPDEWDYTLAGLAEINKEGVDAIRTAVKELENEGYVVRRQTTDKDGKFCGNEYIIHECPVNSTENDEEKAEPDVCAAPLLDFPTTDKPITEKPLSENPTQLNKDISSKDISKRKNKKKSQKGTIPELELVDLLPMFNDWLERMADKYHWSFEQQLEIRKQLKEWYSPRTIKSGGPPVKSERGVHGLCNGLEQDSGGDAEEIIAALKKALDNGWTSAHPKMKKAAQAPANGTGHPQSVEGMGDRM